MKYQAIFIDRDGTMGESSNIHFPTDFVPLEGLKQSIAALKSVSPLILAFSNQSCIARNDGNGYDFYAEFSSYGMTDAFICPHDDSAK